ncbi:MAG: AraC family transcriptional regulator [Clostridia bacterium]|nr:AraC family transcriptional regulator [Clostridia bacterium]
MINKLSRQNYIENGMISCEARKCKNEHVPTHLHDFFEIEYIISGTGTCFIDGEKYSISPGMIFFMSPVNTHNVFIENAEYVNISFSENMCSPELLSQLTIYDKATVSELSGKDAIFLKSVAMELCDNLKNNEYSAMLLDCILTKLINCANPRRIEKDTPASKKAIIYIINHFRENLSLSDTARYMGLTPAYFSGLFKKETGITFKEYLDRLRFENAKKLVLLSDMPIQQICAESGFANYENFIRRFKKRFGVTPTEMRKKAM